MSPGVNSGCRLTWHEKRLRRVAGNRRCGGSHAGDGHSLSMGRGHGDLSFLLFPGVMPRCPTSVKLFSAVDRSQGLGRSRFVLESRITFQVIA